jgi:YVTN family beta-propeller protein
MTPRQVGHYRLDALLGSGGMGEVYKAYDTSRDRYVALKLLPEAFSDDREYLKRFQRESHVAARLTEPHVIPIHDFGEIDGQLFIDMRLVDGVDIGALLEKTGRIEPQRSAYLIGQVAQALDAAHADHLVHRDIKPSNILVTSSDFVYVVDFGIARSIGGRQTALTITGATIGTLHYMAPERFVGHDVDGRADVYSLACVLHECLTGAPPFRGKDLPALMYAQLYYGPPQVSSLVEGIPPALDAVIARGMAKDPNDRFPTAGALAAAAREALLIEAPGPPPPLPSPPVTLLPAPAWTPAAAAPAWPGVSGSPTQTMVTGSTRPPEHVPPGLDLGADDGRLPPAPAVAAGEPARRPAWRRLSVLLLVIAAVLLAVPVALVLTASGKPHASGAPATPSAGRATATTSSTGAVSSARTLAMPTVAGQIQVGQSPSYVEVAPNGKFAYIASPGAGLITVLNTANDLVSGRIKIPQGPPQYISFSPDGKTAYVSVSATKPPVHLIAFIDTATGTVTATVPVDNFTPGPSATSPDGRYLYVPNHNTAMSGANQNAVDVIDIASRKLIGDIAVPPNPHWVVFDKNGRFYTTDHMSAKVTVLSTQNNAIVAEIPVGETPHSEDASPDGSRLAVTSFDGNQVFVIDTATNKMIARIPVGRNPLDITYSPDGRYLFTANNEDNSVTVIDTATNKVIGTVPAGKAPTSISVLPNGRQAYVTDENDGTIEILDIAG